MALSDEFNSTYSPRKIGDNVLRIEYDYVKFYYDFQQRVMATAYRYNDSGGTTLTPFSQLDRDTLVEMRDTLVELGGKPKELPPEGPTLNKPARGLNP
ncbi:MAG: hypothetical protein IT560_07460 [Alphaproteobacteria bacterium]|nr:hypothetical protein [Alphaproteobacteria bacterium]